MSARYDGHYDSLWADRRSVAGSQLGHLCPCWRAESDWHRVTETRARASLRVSCLARARVASEGSEGSEGHPQLRSSRPGDNWDMYRRGQITRAPHQGSGDTGAGLYGGDCSEARTQACVECTCSLSWIMQPCETIHLNHPCSAMQCLIPSSVWGPS